MRITGVFVATADLRLRVVDLVLNAEYGFFCQPLDLVAAVLFPFDAVPDIPDPGVDNIPHRIAVPMRELRKRRVAVLLESTSSSSRTKRCTPTTRC